MKKMYLLSLIICFLLLLPSSVLSASAEKEVSEGNRLYKQEKYDDALAKYNSARTELPDSDIINFNIGSAMYKKGDFQKAIDAFTKALVTEDKELEARANYNIANSKYKLGNLKINTDLSGAVSFYREALDYYKRAIELNQNDTDAKYNHELVEKKLKVLLDRLKNQPEQENRKQDNQDKEGKKDKEGKEGSSQSTAGQKQKEKKETGEQTVQAQQPETGKETGKEEGKPAETGSNEEKEKMSPEEARMLLDAYGDEEAMQMKQAGHGYYDKVLKDW